ncbi:Dickkopf-related protein 3, partial [Ophiophagus hannah]
MFLLGLLFLPALLGMVFSAPASDSKKKEQPQEILLSFPKDETSLNEMLQEVEELMEDTQYKLTNAVKEMEAEEEGSKKIMGIEFQKLPANYHNESYTDTKVGNKTIHRHQEIDKVTDNKTGSTSYSETIITSIQEDRKRNHECIIDEDCETGKYCAFSDLEYNCHICKPQHRHCSRDVECCGQQLCVWGECMQAVSKGENGTICENQHDCNPGLCCAFTKGHYSSDSLCELSLNKTQSEDKKQLLADELSLLDFVTQDIPGEYEERLIKEVQKELEDGVTDPEKLAMASDLFGEDI